jgi:hypothetical protein
MSDNARLKEIQDEITTSVQLQLQKFMDLIDIRDRDMLNAWIRWKWVTKDASQGLKRRLNRYFSVQQKNNMMKRTHANTKPHSIPEV